ncbi:MAG: hypothetical protein ACYTEW_26100 [Planctomycetota bacterium]
MDAIKVATFNVENLSARFRLKRNIKNLEKVLREGWIVSHAYFKI